MNREAFEGAELGLLESTAFPSRPELPPHVCFQETSCWTGEKGGGDILYQGCESQFHALYFSYGGLAARLAGRAAGRVREEECVVERASALRD